MGPIHLFVLKMPTPTTTAIKLLSLLLRYPGTKTRRELSAKLFSDGKDNEKRFFTAKRNLEAAGFEIRCDNQHHYYLSPAEHFKELSYLQSLSEADKHSLKHALKTAFPPSKAAGLFHKIDQLYDWRQLGLDVLRRPNLDKIDTLELASKRKVRVVLEAYRSRNSNTETDRIVEPFLVQPERDLVRAYDLNRQKTSHFKLKRLRRVRLLEQPWQYESLHQHHPSDPFDIVEKRKIFVELELKVSAYTDLIEKHPDARLHCQPGRQPDTYHFSADINKDFIGLKQFILANWRDVNIIRPEELNEVVVKEAGSIAEKYGQ
ncbi:MAG: WYL domain-containing protein [Bacteroidota bacterium]